MDMSKKGNYDTRAYDSRSSFKKNKDSFFAAISYAVIAIALFFSALLVYWSLEPSDVVEIKGQPAVVADEVKKSEGIIKIPIEFCKKLPLEAEVKRSFISNSTEIFQPEIKENAPLGCQKGVYEFPLPPQAVPDTYIIRFQTTYRVNPIKEVTETFETERFRIVP